MDIACPRMKMKFKSLGFRLFITSTLIALIVLPLAAWQLISQYRNSIETNFDERLKANLSLLIESSFSENFDTPQKPTQFGGFAFTLQNSGWYWQIKPENNKGLLGFTSESLGDEKLNLTSRQGVKKEPDGTTKFYITYGSDRRLRVIERKITLGTAQNPQSYIYTVTGDSSEIEDDVIDFASMLSFTFLILGSGLILATLLQVKIGLKPLQAIEHGLTAIRAGKTDKLEGNFPAEIEPLQIEINNLIRSNMNVIERARTHVGNLAHALKTPLSVVKNEVGSQTGNLANKIGEQVDIMQNQISHHLDRARMAAHVGIVGSLTEIAPILKALERVLQRIHQDKALKFSLNCPETASFAGEKQDFEEIIGNLLDNAFKWATSAVSCTVICKESKAGTAAKAKIKSTAKEAQVKDIIVITVDDDGPGLSEKERQQVLKRGKRLDETVPGSGLGLSIVTDLVDLYGGDVALETSPLGGVRVKIQLPAGS